MQALKACLATGFILLIGAMALPIVVNHNEQVVVQLDERLTMKTANDSATTIGNGKHATLNIRKASQQRILAVYDRLPLRFEANQGQAERQVKFLSRGSGYGLFLTPTEAVLTLNRRQGQTGDKVNKGHGARGSIEKPAPLISKVLRIKPVGANPSPTIEGLEELSGHSNYFIGTDPSRWTTNIPNHAKVQYRNVYPGVDLVYYGKQRELEHDWVVAPGGDPKAIRFALEGAEQLRINARGDLIVAIGEGELRLLKPVVYQIGHSPRKDSEGSQYDENPVLRVSNRRLLDGRYILKENNIVAFELAAYDPGRPLVIDPVLTYSTFLGGSGIDQGNSIAVDAAGNAYITGATASPNFPTLNPFQSDFHGIQDAFVAKFNPGASGAASLIYSTYLGGSKGNAFGLGIAVDGSGNAYVTGGTGATDFPTTPGAFQTTAPSQGTGFVTKLDAAGSAVVYSTFLSGSSNNNQGLAIAVDSLGGAYVTGFTASADFPSTPGGFQKTLGGSFDAFIAKLNPAGSALDYSTFLGGSGDEQGHAIAVDSAGNAYVTGGTGSANFPTTTGVFQTSFGGVGDAFVAKFNPALSGSASLVYSTYFGGNGNDQGNGIAVDSSGNAYITGFTFSTNFATTPGAFQTTLNGQTAFVTKMNATASALVYSTLLGGDFTQSDAIAVDSTGNAAVTGDTGSATFPVTADAFRSQNGVAHDAFLTKLNATGTALIFSTGLGGTNLNIGHGIAVDSADSIYVTGETRSADFPMLNAFQPLCGSCTPSLAAVDAFMAKIAFPPPAPAVSLSPSNLTFGNVLQGTASSPQAVTLTNTGNAVLNISSIALVGVDYQVTPNCGSQVPVGGSCAINVTFNPSGTVTNTSRIDITDDATGSPQSIQLTGTGATFLLRLANGAPSSATVSAGQTATFNLMIDSSSQRDNLSLSCGASISAGSCGLSPAQLQLPLSNSAAVAVTVTTTARTVAGLPPTFRDGRRPQVLVAVAAWLLLPLILFFDRNAFRRSRMRFLALAGTAALILIVPGCGGGNSGGPPPPSGTPAGTYALTVTVTSSANSPTQTLQLTLRVN